MEFCEQCGSTSRDSAGFCRGCGAVPKRVEPVIATADAHSAQLPIPFSQPTPTLSLPAIDLVQPTPKSVWVAVVLAFAFGPVGMLYSTVTGCLVMTVASTFLLFAVGRWTIWLTWLACMVWAGVAARD